jgi:hypothetical protein
MQPRQDPVYRAIVLPQSKPTVHRLPFAVSLRQLSPLSAGVQHPKNTVEDCPVVPPLPAATTPSRQQIFDERILLIAELVTLCHCDLLVTRPSIINDFDSPNRT